ncbi:enoyl-CoA hydratase/isomerase family protein [Streptosporangium sp. NPDC002607]
MSSDDPVLLDEPAPGVRLITLNRPQVRNAMTTEVTAAWTEAIAEVAEDDTVRALVVTGAGSSFCSGADLSWLDQGASTDTTPTKMRDRMLPFYRTWLSPRELPFPVIAAINGPAVGAGLCAALACDLRYASTSARFSAPFIYLGTHGGMAATWLLPEAVGVPRARELLYTGRELNAEEALEWGLVSGVADDVLDHSLKMAQHIATAAPIATRLTKAGLEQSANGLAASLQWEALAQPVTLATSDVHEGIQSKRERRPPAFTGN